MLGLLHQTGTLGFASLYDCGMRCGRFGDLRETGREAIAQTLDRLPARFPKQVSASIRTGFLRRFELIERT